MIYVVGGIKGGSGKTTIATNLAIFFAKNNEVLLIDADDQATSTHFSAFRNSANNKEAEYTLIQLKDQNVRTEALKLKSKYDHIIIDTGGRDTISQRAAMSIANIYLIPFTPRSFDIWTIDNVSKLIQEILPINPDLKIYAFINKADTRGSDNEDAKELIQKSQNIKFLNMPIGHRKVFANASSQGLGINEYKPVDEKAVKELSNFCNNIIQL